MRKTSSLVIIITLILGIMLAYTISGVSAIVFAQKNQTKINVTSVGKGATKIINQTSVPATQTTITVQKKTESVKNIPLPGNQTKLLPTNSQVKLLPVSNKTTITPTGKATTTIINETSTPINVISTKSSTVAKQPQPAGDQTANTRVGTNRLANKLFRDR